MIEFLLNGRLEKLDQCDPNQSILGWLRTKMRLTGTKEGCASGDCGACTVIVGTPDAGGNVRYEAINSCIALVGSLHGKELVTVDAFKATPGHPVQKAMVDCYGAQCGFCTPGIVMSLIALHRAGKGEAVDDPAILEALSGNLCRCTGYRPIVEAARQSMVQQWQPDKGGFLDADPSRLSQADRPGTATLTDNNGALYQAPDSLDALKALLRDHPEARLIAGGTDLALEITQQLNALPHLISVERVQALKRCELGEKALAIGAAVTYRQLQAPLASLWPAFDGLLERLGSLQIRNRGTLGGNIGNASPIGDMPPPLIALDATLVLDGPRGRRRMPIEDFFKGYRQTDLQPGELIHSVEIPVPRDDEQLFIYKISKRLDDDISAVLFAMRLTLENGRVADCRLAFGGMATTPARAFKTEKALLGKPWTAQTVNMAIPSLGNDFAPLSDVRASSDYRLQVAGNLLTRALIASTLPDQSSQPLMVTDYA